MYFFCATTAVRMKLLQLCATELPSEGTRATLLQGQSQKKVTHLTDLKNKKIKPDPARCYPVTIGNVATVYEYRAGFL